MKVEEAGLRGTYLKGHSGRLRGGQMVRQQLS